MADNTTLNLGVGGDVVATDDIGGIKHQQVKVEWGIDGTATPVSAANPMPVVQTGTLNVGTVTAVTAITNALPAGAAVIGQVTANAGTNLNTSTLALESGGNVAGIRTSVELIDDAVATLGTTTYTEATTKGIVIGGVRRDANTTLVNTTNEVAPIQLSALGAVKVAITEGAGSGGTALADAAAFTRATTSITPIGGVVETSAPTVTNGNASVISLTPGGAVRVAVASGAVLGVVEDAAASGTAEGILSVVVRDDALATLTPVDGDYTSQRVNARGATWVALDSTAAQTVTLAAGTATNEVVGDAAHDAAIAGNPVRVAGRGMSADYTAVATGDTTDILTSLLGKIVVQPYALPGATWSSAAASGGIVNTTGVTAKAAAGASIRNYVTHAQVINGHATVSTDVQIRDGAAGTVLHRGFAQAAGGGFTCKFDPPLRGTANTLIEIACGTTGSAVYINLQGFAAAE